MKVLFFIFIILFAKYPSFAQKAIYNNDYPDKDTIFIGIVRINNSASTLFTLKNLKLFDVPRLKIGRSLPSFFFGEAPGHPFEWEEFSKSFLTGELFEGDIDIPQDSSFTFRINYYADPRLPQYPLGLKKMRLILGLYDPAISQPISDKELVVVDTFLLMAKKTFHWVDSYYDIYNFDSVYIKCKFPPKFNWKLKNINSEIETINNYRFDDFSDKKEFNITQPKVPIQIEANNPRSVIDFTEISYKPLNRGRDSAKITIDYTPLPPEIADTIPMPHLRAFGIGVEQEINLIDAGDAAIIKQTIADTLGYTDSLVIYTIDAGNVRIGYSKLITGTIRNDGNLNFGIKKQAIFSQFADINAEDITIIKPLGQNYFHLPPNGLDTFQLIFQPQTIGNYLFRYVIESDITERKIYGIPPYARKVVINIVAKGVSPKYSITKDTFNLGKVFIGCPPTRHEVVYINNIGNEELILQPFIEYPSFFRVEPNELVIQPLSNNSFTFTYSINEIGAFEQVVKLHSNENPPTNIHYLHFSGEGIPLKRMQISIPNIKSQPGKIISIPILVNKDLISSANRYTDTLIYDPSLLSFELTDFANTASEGSQLSENTKIIDNRNGKIFIHLQMPIKNQYFRAKDTLIKFLFKTFLGNKISSQTAITSPIFSDEICDKVLDIDPNFDISNGTFSLDSVCGLQYKAYERMGLKFSLYEIKPIPTSDMIEIDFELAYNTNVSFSLYNSFGEKVLSQTLYSQPQGRHKHFQDLHNIPPGIYYLEMKASIFSSNVKVIIAR